MRRAPRELKVGEGPLAAASPQTLVLGGNRLRAPLGDPPVVYLTRSACRPQAGRAENDLRSRSSSAELCVVAG
jgi:hypothetical protein